jgi:hypothetical protein
VSTTDLADLTRELVDFFRRPLFILDTGRYCSVCWSFSIITGDGDLVDSVVPFFEKNDNKLLLRVISIKFNNKSGVL